MKAFKFQSLSFNYKDQRAESYFIIAALEFTILTLKQLLQSLVILLIFLI